MVDVEGMPKPPMEMRPQLSLEELLELLVRTERIDDATSRDIAAREKTLHSQVLKDRVGSVRSQAAARYDVSPAEIVAIAHVADARNPKRRLDEDGIAEVLAEAADLPYLKLDPLKIDNNLVTRSLSRPFARRHAVLPVAQEGEVVTLAVTDPFDGALRDSLRQTLRVPFDYVVTSKKDILAIIDRVYGFRSSVTAAGESLGAGTKSGALAELVELRSNEELATSNDAHVIAAVDYVLNYAFDQRASDIHIEPRDGSGVIRFRIDGILHDIETLPLSVHGAVTSRIKVLARMDIAERRRPQDGRIKTFRNDREVELRVSSLMTAFGEKVVIRVFDPTVLMTELEDLGFGRDDRERFESWITSPSGLVLVTGPTGSGKTTTLYSTLRYLSGPEINITTVEDPIEMVDSRFCQVQGAAPGRRHVRDGASLHPPTGPRHHHGRRDPRRRDGTDGRPGRAHRPPRLLDAAHARRRGRGDAPARARRRAVPALERAARRARAAARAQDLSALRRRRHADARPGGCARHQGADGTPRTAAGALG